MRYASPATPRDLPAAELLLWPGLALLATLMSRRTDIDMRLSALFFDPVTARFPHREEWLWSSLLHTDIKKVSTLVFVALIALAVRAWRSGRTEQLPPLLFTLAGALLALTLNSHLKHLSPHSCPWSLQAFGGSAEYFRILSPVPAGAGPGACLPSGHAATGFMWLPGVYACLRWQPRLALPAATAAILLGLLCGLTQIVRGAHFLSHIMLTAAVCGSTGSVLHHLCAAWPRPAMRQPDTADTRDTPCA